VAAAKMTPRENQVLQTALAILKKEINPSRVILFGSRADGRPAPGFDFDLAVDIVYLPNVERDFRDLVLKTGKVVYER